MAGPPTQPSSGRPLPGPPNKAWKLVADNDPKTARELSRTAHRLARLYMRKLEFSGYVIDREAEDLAQRALLHVILYARAETEPAYERPEQLLGGFIYYGCLALRRQEGDQRLVELPAGVDFDPADGGDAAIGSIMAFETHWKAVITAYERELEPPCRELIELLYVEKK
jgi:hypothetical protein